MKTKAEIYEDSHPGRIVVETHFMLKEQIKAVPGAKWDSDSRVWTVPLSWPSALALREEFGADLELGPKLTAWGKEQAPKKAYLRELRNAIEEPGPPMSTHKPGFAELYPYQKTGAELIRIAGRYVFFDETGAGKSRTALAGLSLLAEETSVDDVYAGKDVFPVLIVAPKSMLRTWRTEIKGFFPDAIVQIVEGSPTAVDAALSDAMGLADFYIISYDTARLRSRHAPFPTVKLTEAEKTDGPLQKIAFKTVIADEAHRIKNPKSKRTRALWHLGKEARYIIGLTGTPVQDTPEDLWSILRFIAPDEYPVKSGYIDRYCNVTFNYWGGREITGINPHRSEEFFGNLDARSRRITKAAALPFLPEKVYETRWVSLPARHRKLYDDVEKRMFASTLDGEDVIAVGSVLEKAGRLVQIANAAGHIDSAGVFHMDGKNSPKVDSFMEDVLDGDYDGQQVVVFSDSKKLLELVSEAMNKAKIPYSMITGDVTGEDRETAMEVFQKGDVQFILLTKAGGEGITLTAASTMVRLVRSWSYTVHTQAEDRVHRIGSEKHESVRYVDYIVEDTVEEGQLAKLSSKEKRAQEVLRDAELMEMISRKVSK
jgi:SNF2 family DNA or RNA helicase